MTHGRRIYLDHNATAPLRPAVRAAMQGALDLAGNPSSVHAEGRAARRVVEGARRALAAHCGVPAAGIAFTSGATEAAAHALTPEWRRAGEPLVIRSLIVSAIEHPCVLAGGRFPPAARRILPVDRDGVADLDALSAMLGSLTEAERPALVALMLANNETGVIQPVERAGAICRANGALLLIDAVQGFGRLPLGAHGAAALLLSAHKAGGPKGVGALVCPDAELRPAPVLTGGAQEGGARAGTQNVLALAGLSALLDGLEAATASGVDATACAALRDSFEARLHTIWNGEAMVVGEREARLPNTSLVVLPGLPAETALIALDLAGIAVSSGSACSSGRVGPSHVLTAMGMAPALARCALRISLGADSSAADVERLCEVLGSLRSGTIRTVRPAGLEPAGLEV